MAIRCSGGGLVAFAINGFKACRLFDLLQGVFVNGVLKRGGQFYFAGNYFLHLDGVSGKPQGWLIRGEGWPRRECSKNTNRAGSKKCILFKSGYSRVDARQR